MPKKYLTLLPRYIDEYYYPHVAIMHIDLETVAYNVNTLLCILGKYVPVVSAMDSAQQITSYKSESALQPEL